jgi:hypothetical protein
MLATRGLQLRPISYGSGPFMQLNYWEYLARYYHGFLGPGPVLEFHILFAYLFSFLCSACVGVSSLFKWIKSFGARALFFICLVPTILVTPLLVQGFISNDSNAFDVSFYITLAVPATWALPILTFYYGSKLKFESASETHKMGYAIVVVLEGWVLGLFLHTTRNSFTF